MPVESAEPPALPPPPARRGGCLWALFGVTLSALVAVAAGGGVMWGKSSVPAPSAVTVVQAGPPVLTAVRDLARLQTAEYHMERVIDLREKQKRLLGLIESEDAILLVAAARITAGVDLRLLGDGDVVADFDNKRVTITLPAAQVFEAALDNDRTYVRLRDTDMLAKRTDSLETRARQQAELDLIAAAKEAGILRRAEDNARNTVEGLLRSLGYQDITVRFAGS